VDEILARTGEPRLHIVAECNGGVATRYYLQALGGFTQVEQVVTFVSAHHGTWLSPIGEWVTGFESLDEIIPTSAFMQELDSLPFPPGLELTSIYSCNDELMLPYDTSVVDGATNVRFCDHYLKHFDGFWDTTVYERILVTLQGQGHAAPTEY
jgi:triacylglycerol lipase